MLRYGMPVLLEMKTPEDNAALCRELGLSFVELNLNLPQYQTGSMDVPRLREIARRYGIAYTFHLDENLNLYDFNPIVARAWRDTMLETIALARELDVPVLNIHLNRGIHFTLPDRKVYLFEEYRQPYLDGVRAFRDACAEAIGGSGVRVCVENTSGYPAWQVETLDVLLESEAFGLTFDVGHDHCAGAGDRQVILDRADRLCHMHLHDAVTPNRDHLALGDGALDLHDRLALAKRCGCSVVLEIKTAAALRQSVDWMRRSGGLEP